ncbi:MAG: hypothetical protein ACKV2O_03885 [Acidimicrobiales bacterium]
MRSKRVGAVLLAGLAMLFVAFGAAPAFGAHGAQNASPPAVTDYENYPLGLGIIPEGCTTQGAGLLVGEAYSVNGAAPVADLRLAGEIPADATIEMTWDGFAPGCAGIGVSLSRKVAPAPTFDANVNQYVNVWTYCGPGGAPCAGSLTLDLSVSTGVACYQIDANAGPPLNVVGPAGSFYSMNERFNTLISANNGGTAPCDAEPCLQTNAPADMPSTAAACADIAVTTTTAATTTAPPVTTSGSAVPSTTAPPLVATSIAATPTSTVGSVAQVTLPRTGAETTEMIRIGGSLVAAGLLFAAAARRWRVDPAT